MGREPFEFGTALVRAVPSTITRALSKESPAGGIDFAECVQQHHAYVERLLAAMGSGASVVEVAADDRHPDCVFVEDVAVVSGNVAVITRPGHPSRRGEVGPVAEAICSKGPFAVVEIGGEGTVDGGDVLIVNDLCLVGISSRTNEEGARQLAGALMSAGIQTVSVPVPPGELHLKSIVSVMDESTFVVWGCGQAPMDVAAHIRACIEGKRGPAATAHITFVEVPDRLAANVLRVCKTVFFQPVSPQSRDAIVAAATERGLHAVELDMGELAKADGALTCCSILW